MALTHPSIKTAATRTRALSYVAFSFDTHKFIEFPSYEAFSELKHLYPYLHEIVFTENLDVACKQMHRTDGRLCFDFDYTTITSCMFDVDAWMLEVERVIKQTSNDLFDNISTNRLTFVWLTSHQGPCRHQPSFYKLSKHLVINGLYFERWIEMSKQFYARFIANWGLSMGITADVFVDKQIIRRNSMMRMAGSSKVDGLYPLVFDCSMHTIGMSLIRPKELWASTQEQTVGLVNLCVPLITPKHPSCLISTSIPKDRVPVEAMVNAFRFSHTIETESGSIDIYRRTESSDCLICEREHDRENAYVLTTPLGLKTWHCYHNNEVCLELDTDPSTPLSMPTMPATCQAALNLALEITI
ncbi:Hypothetical protein MVR_LOCUS245 [uncultured virus]|nr:Hypothetical protein MVR_LOCUS245 [uncultured virus]